MSLLKPLGQGQGYLKAGFLGFPKSGKTYTAVELALGTRDAMHLAGPIAFYDTEGGSEYVSATVRKRTGQDLLGVRSRSFDDILAMARECEGAGVSVLIADSMTHVWRELCEAYLKQVNEGRSRRNLKPRYNLEFADWNPIKKKWSEWTDFFLNSKLHIVICGRAGYEYDFEKNEEDGKKTLIKTGVKMKTEAEFGFEPSLLVEMERIQDLRGETTQILHRATVIGDRYSVIDGASCDNPTYEFFSPHVKLLVPGAHAPIDMATKTDVGVDAEGQDPWRKELKERTILCEEIQGELLARWPGATAAEKASKAKILEELLGTRSWTKVENTESGLLRSALEKLRKIPREGDK